MPLNVRGGCSDVAGIQASVIIDEIAPWQDLVEDTVEEGRFDRFYNAIQTSFAIGYVVGQMLDVTDIDTRLVEDFLREKKSLLYLPHKKKAA
jgi:hypothetical protein